jgi:hypothetical protein
MFNIYIVVSLDKSNNKQGNIIKQSTQWRGKGRTKIMDPNPNHKTQKNQTWGSQRGKGTKYVPKPPPITRSIWQ